MDTAKQTLMEDLLYHVGSRDPQPGQHCEDHGVSIWHVWSEILMTMLEKALSRGGGEPCDNSLIHLLGQGAWALAGIVKNEDGMGRGDATTHVSHNHRFTHQHCYASVSCVLSRISRSDRPPQAHLEH